jgi:hypothetical protein
VLTARAGSLKNHGVDEAAAWMFEMGAETMALPLEEKMKYEQGDGGMSFGCVYLPRVRSRNITR